MDKNSTHTTISFIQSDRQNSAMPTPSVATLSRVRQFARSYVYFQQANSLGGIILN